MTMQDQIDAANQIAAVEYQMARSNTDLVPDARDRILATTYTTLKAKIDQITTAEGKAANARRDVLAERVFGLPAGGDAMSYRDAISAAKAIETSVDGTEALPMLEQARLTHDDLLGRGVLAVAFASGWSAVVNQHEADVPAETVDCEELWGLYQDARPQTAKTIMAAAWMTVVPTPPELQRFSEYQIKQMYVS